MIKKAVLPAAGLGTRFLPASKATPKEMLPIIDKPLIQYAVEEAVSIGINEIIFITSSEKYSIKKHFDKNIELESKLKKIGKEEILQKVNPNKFADVQFHYVNQAEQNGLGHAILEAEDLINNEPFAVLLPDDLFSSEKSCLQQLLDVYMETKSSVIAVNKVDKDNIHKYGVIKPGTEDSQKILIEDIVEKPKAEEAPSDIAVCGRYIFNPSIFEQLKKVTFDNSGEILLTDGIRNLLLSEDVFACLYDGEKFDCGSKKGFVHATISLALRDPSISEDIKQLIREII